MKKVKKALLVSLVGVVLAGGGVTYTAIEKDNKVVVLGSQKDEIESELAIKSMDNVNFFEGECWLKDGRILGVKDQARNENSKVCAKLCIYNPEDKSFEELVTAKDKEWICTGDMSKDQRYIFYSVMLNGDFSANIYDYYVFDLQSKKTIKLVENMTATMPLEDNQVLVAAGMKLYKCDVTGIIEEIELPEELIEGLSDFSDFTFEDYLDTYYNLKKVEGETLKLLQSNYNADKKHNGIRFIDQLGDKLFLRSHNHKIFSYSIKEKTYKRVSWDEYPDFRHEKDELNKRTKNEFLETGNVIIWEIDETGEKIKMIDEGDLGWNGVESPDNSKLIYHLRNKAGDVAAYIYDLDTDEKIKIFPKITNYAIWDYSSKMFFMSSYTSDEDKKLYGVTSIVKLND